MVMDLSYLSELPSEAQESAVQKAVEEQCLLAIIQYLTEVADTMEQNSLECLSPPSLRAMAETLNQRLENGENESN
jgi:hypothetical protein